MPFHRAQRHCGQRTLYSSYLSILDLSCYVILRLRVLYQVVTKPVSGQRLLEEKDANRQRELSELMAKLEDGLRVLQDIKQLQQQDHSRIDQLGEALKQADKLFEALYQQAVSSPPRKKRHIFGLGKPPDQSEVRKQFKVCEQ